LRDALNYQNTKLQFNICQRFFVVADFSFTLEYLFLHFPTLCIMIAIDFVSAHSTSLDIFPAWGEKERLNEALLLFNLTAAEKIFTLSSNAVVEFIAVFFVEQTQEETSAIVRSEIFFYSVRNERETVIEGGSCIASVMVHLRFAAVLAML
jgi:hypothetical protein